MLTNRALLLVSILENGYPLQPHNRHREFLSNEKKLKRILQ